MALGIEHRLTQPRTPKTNGWSNVATLASPRPSPPIDSTGPRLLKTTLTRYLWLYNHHQSQEALGHCTPMQAMKK